MDDRKWFRYIRKIQSPMGPCNETEVKQILETTPFADPFLEVGAGIGSAIGDLVISMGKRYVGTDLLAWNKKKMDAHELDEIGNGEVGTVFSSNVFEHLISPLIALWEWNRVLWVGGQVIIGLPQGEGHKTSKEHVCVYDEQQMKLFFEQSGFLLTSTHRHGDVLFYIAKKIKEEW